jgi:hypothetical protein
MRTDLRMRLGLLVALAVVGVVVAGVGTTLGGGSPLAPASGGEFVVSESNVTFADRSRDVTVVDDMENVTRVEITEAAEGRFRVETDRTRPLTAADRELAREIARSNGTVATNLATIARPELTVDPVKRIEANAIQFNVSVTTENESRGVTVVEVENGSMDTGEHGVVIDREPSYVDGRAVVRISDPAKEKQAALQYSVRVDLANETVTEITNWTAIRADAPAVAGTKIESATTNDSG